jgi:hypothetical protein
MPLHLLNNALYTCSPYLNKTFAPELNTHFVKAYELHFLYSCCERRELQSVFHLRLFRRAGLCSEPVPHREHCLSCREQSRRDFVWSDIFGWLKPKSEFVGNL